MAVKRIPLHHRRRKYLKKKETIEGLNQKISGFQAKINFASAELTPPKVDTLSAERVIELQTQLHKDKTMLEMSKAEKENAEQKSDNLKKDVDKRKGLPKNVRGAYNTIANDREKTRVIAKEWERELAKRKSKYPNEEKNRQEYKSLKDNAQKLQSELNSLISASLPADAKAATEFKNNIELKRREVSQARQNLIDFKNDPKRVPTWKKNERIERVQRRRDDYNIDAKVLRELANNFSFDKDKKPKEQTKILKQAYKDFKSVQSVRDELRGKIDAAESTLRPRSWFARQWRKINPLSEEKKRHLEQKLEDRLSDHKVMQEMIQNAPKTPQGMAELKKNIEAFKEITTLRDDMRRRIYNADKRLAEAIKNKNPQLENYYQSKIADLREDQALFQRLIENAPKNAEGLKNVKEMHAALKELITAREEIRKEMKKITKKAMKLPAGPARDCAQRKTLDYGNDAKIIHGLIHKTAQLNDPNKLKELKGHLEYFKAIANDRDMFNEKIRNAEIKLAKAGPGEQKYYERKLKDYKEQYAFSKELLNNTAESNPEKLADAKKAIDELKALQQKLDKINKGMRTVERRQADPATNAAKEKQLMAKASNLSMDYQITGTMMKKVLNDNELKKDPTLLAQKLAAVNAVLDSKEMKACKEIRDKLADRIKTQEDKFTDKMSPVDQTYRKEKIKELEATRATVNPWMSDVCNTMDPNKPELLKEKLGQLSKAMKQVDRANEMKIDILKKMREVDGRLARLEQRMSQYKEPDFQVEQKEYKETTQFANAKSDLLAYKESLKGDLELNKNFINDTLKSSWDPKNPNPAETSKKLGEMNKTLKALAEVQKYKNSFHERVMRAHTLGLKIAEKISDKLNITEAFRTDDPEVKKLYDETKIKYFEEQKDLLSSQSKENQDDIAQLKAETNIVDASVKNVANALLDPKNPGVAQAGLKELSNSLKMLARKQEKSLADKYNLFQLQNKELARKSASVNLKKKLEEDEKKVKMEETKAAEAKAKNPSALPQINLQLTKAKMQRSLTNVKLQLNNISLAVTEVKLASQELRFEDSQRDRNQISKLIERFTNPHPPELPLSVDNLKELNKGIKTLTKLQSFRDKVVNRMQWNGYKGLLSRTPEASAYYKDKINNMKDDRDLINKIIDDAAKKAAESRDPSALEHAAEHVKEVQKAIQIRDKVHRDLRNKEVELGKTNRKFQKNEKTIEKSNEKIKLREEKIKMLEEKQKAAGGKLGFADKMSLRWAKFSLRWNQGTVKDCTSENEILKQRQLDLGSEISNLSQIYSTAKDNVKNVAENKPDKVVAIETLTAMRKQYLQVGNAMKNTHAQLVAQTKKLNEVNAKLINNEEKVKVYTAELSMLKGLKNPTKENKARIEKLNQNIVTINMNNIILAHKKTLISLQIDFLQRDYALLQQAKNSNSPERQGQIMNDRAQLKTEVTAEREELERNFVPPNKKQAAAAAGQEVEVTPLQPDQLAASADANQGEEAVDEEEEDADAEVEVKEAKDEDEEEVIELKPIEPAIANAEPPKEASEQVATLTLTASKPKPVESKDDAAPKELSQDNQAKGQQPSADKPEANAAVAAQANKTPAADKSATQATSAGLKPEPPKAETPKEAESKEEAKSDKDKPGSKEAAPGNAADFAEYFVALNKRAENQEEKAKKEAEEKAKKEQELETTTPNATQPVAKAAETKSEPPKPPEPKVASQTAVKASPAEPKPAPKEDKAAEKSAQVIAGAGIAQKPAVSEKQKTLPPDPKVFAIASATVTNPTVIVANMAQSITNVNKASNNQQKSGDEVAQSTKQPAPAEKKGVLATLKSMLNWFTTPKAPKKLKELTPEPQAKAKPGQEPPEDEQETQKTGLSMNRGPG